MSAQETAQFFTQEVEAWPCNKQERLIVKSEIKINNKLND